ncbi:hypothetical protein DFH11DRAFT_1547766 [Phellopilus nigrolimitatus]|nr:hypothetical protein DFH11DRAFT_1547766 [Phellopilus nigrolimitatus]
MAMATSMSSNKLLLLSSSVVHFTSLVIVQLGKLRRKAWKQQCKASTGEYQERERKEGEVLQKAVIKKSLRGARMRWAVRWGGGAGGEVRGQTPDVAALGKKKKAEGSLSLLYRQRTNDRKVVKTINIRNVIGKDEGWRKKEKRRGGKRVVRAGVLEGKCKE